MRAAGNASKMLPGRWYCIMAISVCVLNSGGNLQA
jgi:hypothetical protein